MESAFPTTTTTASTTSSARTSDKTACTATMVMAHLPMSRKRPDFWSPALQDGALVAHSWITTGMDILTSSFPTTSDFHLSTHPRPGEPDPPTGKLSGELRGP